MFPRDLLIIDTETTGLDITRHSVLQLGAVLIDKDSLEEKYHYCSYIYATKKQFQAADERALRINGINIDMTKKAPTWKESFTTMLHETKKFKYHIAGQNLQFDVSFMKQMCRRYRFKYPFGRDRELGAREIDLWPVFLSVGAFKDLPYIDRNASLYSMCKYFNIETKSHDALADCRATAEVLRRMKVLISGE